MKRCECPNCGYTMTSNDKFCPYCGTANVEYIDPNKIDLVNKSFSENKEAFDRNKKDFSIGIFVLLLFIFWPAAIIYAIAYGTKK